MPQKLAFSVASCSGEDPDFPVSELLFHSPDSKGWCTPRFPPYPQELTLRLEAPARLAQIQLLSHEYKIAAKVELLVGNFEAPGPGGSMPGTAAGAAAAAAGADISKATWRRLGFLSFDANERSNFTARELKSVALNGTPAQLLRLVFHRCHANAANMYSQVSLVAISLLGDPLAPAPLSPITNTAGPYGGMQQQLASPPAPTLGMGMGMPGMGMLPPQAQPQYMQPPLAGQAPPYMQPPPPVHQQQQQQQPYLQPQHQAPPLGAPPTKEESAAALAAELGVDPVTAQRIAELQQQKQEAVEREDYDEAKRLKTAVDRLRAAGAAIAQLEEQKRAAVEEEDYDAAKQLKLEIDRMRAAAYAAALEGHGGSGLEAMFLQPGSRRASATGAAPVRGTGGGPRPSGDDGSGRLSAEPSAAATRQQQAENSNENASPPAARRQAAGPSSSSSGRPADWHSYDERPAQAKGAYNFQNADETTLPTTIRGGGGGAVAVRASQSRAASDAGPAPPGFPADLPAPEALSTADAKDAGPLVDLVGEYLARGAYSRTWQLREAALARVATDLEGGQLNGSSADVLKAVSRGLLVRSLKDKVPAVVSSSLRALRALVGAAVAGKAAPRDLQAAVAELLPLLVEKAADLNQRTREQTTEALVALGGVPEVGLANTTGPFLRAIKPNTAWKVVLGRLQLVSALLPVLGMSGRASSEGFPLEGLMDFVNPALSNSSAEVRSAAVALTVQAAQLVGPSVQRLLPADLNSKVREQITQGMTNPAAVLGAGGQPAGAAAGRAPAPGPARGAASSATTPAKQKQQAPGPAAVATTALPPTLQQQAVQQQQQQQQQPGSPGPGDDPAVYEAEVRAREAQLGPNHPDVAESICNLAILHNQRGNTAAALPLYERALAIWEAASGPDSPDVAHTLTDIAVIHLEQGRDDIGRPLLQRALRIQEAHLGPDHPDVMAIRDVLEEEG